MRLLHRVVTWQDLNGIHAVCGCGWSFSHRWSLPAVRVASSCHLSAHPVAFAVA